MSIAWYQFLVGLWQRSGAAIPPSAQSVFLQLNGAAAIEAFNSLTGEPIQTLGGVSNIDTGAGLGGGPITGAGTIFILDTGVTAGAYHLANITVNERGQLTFAAAGTVSLTADVSGQLPLANIASIADVVLLGNDSGGVAPPSTIGVGPGLELLASVLDLAPVEAGLVATGLTQAAGYALDHGVYIFETVTVTDNAATLPNTPGRVIVLNRDAADAMQLFPPVGGQIEALGIDAPAAIGAVTGSQQCFSADGLAWKVITT